MAQQIPGLQFISNNIIPILGGVAALGLGYWYLYMRPSAYISPEPFVYRSEATSTTNYFIGVKNYKPGERVDVFITYPDLPIFRTVPFTSMGVHPDGSAQVSLGTEQVVLGMMSTLLSSDRAVFRMVGAESANITSIELNVRQSR